MRATGGASGRYAVVLLSVSLAAASVGASGAPAAALAYSCGGGNAGLPRAGGGPGSGAAVCGAAELGRPGVRAQALALFRQVDSRGRAAASGGAGLPVVTREGVSVPVPGTSSQLEGVFCTSSSNCWAVGGYSSGGAELNQALRWNGTKWSKVTIPSPGGTGSGSFSELFGVRCNSASDCWAVGDYTTSTAELNQALHWNGTKWSKVTTPNPGGTSSGDFSVVFDVWCTSASNCWAAGEDGVLSGATEVILNQALRWNGTKWSQVTTPNPEGTAANDANALGSVRCTSASNCWAVGTYGFVGSPITLLNEALHWNGGAWTLVSTPDPGGTANLDSNTLRAVRCTAASNCWTVGDAQQNGAQDLNQALHWNGAKWSPK
jgi:hypothetical protein